MKSVNQALNIHRKTHTLLLLNCGRLRIDRVEQLVQKEACRIDQLVAENQPIFTLQVINSHSQERSLVLLQNPNY